MKRINEFKNQHKQYGLLRFILYLAILSLRIFGIKYERYRYMTIPIDYDKQLHYWESHNVGDVKELNYDDFKRGDPNVFNENKMRLYKERFNEVTYHAYGIFENEILIYSCWISLKELTVANSNVKCEISPNESLKIDAYCHPAYRGKGIHGAMNAFRILKASEFKKDKSVALVYWLNKPAIKSQLKVGYSIPFSFYVLQIWGKVLTNFYRKKNLCK